MICIYDKNTTDFNNNGLVVLSDCKSCFITEKNNDLFELEIEYPLDQRGKWQNILEGNIIKADGQLFRIYHKFKSITGIKANARHIFYDLLDNFLEDVRPTNLNGAGALNWMLSHTQYPHLFTGMSDVAVVNTKYFIKKNPIEAIMGQDGIIANWGGELVRDNFTIKLLQARGLDRGVLVAYGKNIIGIEETINLDSVITRIYPTGKDGMILSEKYVDSQFINNYPHPKIKEIQFSDIDNEVDLRIATQNYFVETKCDIPLTNYTVNFIELSKTEEYKNYAILETVYMGDTVTVKHNKLNIDLKCKVISIKKNILTNRIEEIELGNFKPNFASSINNAIQTINSIADDIGILNPGVLAQAVANATNLIVSGNDGHVVQDENGISIMDTTDKNTAVEVWRWNVNGLGFSSTGWNGPFGTAITKDGKIVADYITTGKLSGDSMLMDLNAGTFRLGLSDTNFKLLFDGNNLIFGGGSITWANLDDTTKANLKGETGTSPYEVTIISSNGDKFRYQTIFTTTLYAYIYQGGINVTDLIDYSKFNWVRSSSDIVGDTVWNNNHMGYKSIIINQDDVLENTTFTCEITN